MPAPSPQWIPLCTAHELRRDFRDLALSATALSSTPGDSLLSPLRDSRLDALWSRNPPWPCTELGAAVLRFAPATRCVLLIARSAVQEVAGELPAVDPLGANLRRLCRGEMLQEGSHLLLVFDDRVRPCIGWLGDWRETDALLERLSRLSDETLPILVRGATGTGKEMIARAIHVLGRRRDRPYLAINCAELPESIVESELFGHTRGAFTGATADRIGLFEAAGDGTVFLDEIGELPLAVQAKLLRVLEEHRVRRVGSSQPRPLSCRVVAATNRELQKEIGRGRFRADLFYRLRGSEVVLPPLGERREDLLALAEFFAARAELRFRRGPIRLSEDAKLALMAHDWPGNIRELRQLIEVGVLACRGDLLDSQHLGLIPSAVAETTGAEPLLTARAVERAHILRALASTAGNRMAAAKILGLSRQSLQRRMIRHGILSPAESGQSGTVLLPETGCAAKQRTSCVKGIG
jgi:DNA-binding NtrC family response regulator